MKTFLNAHYSLGTGYHFLPANREEWQKWAVVLFRPNGGLGRRMRTVSFFGLFQEFFEKNGKAVFITVLFTFSDFLTT